MGLIFTPFISYHEINVKETDLFEDAWGLNSGYSDVIQFLGEFKPEPEKKLISRLIELIGDTN
ncbi:MAG: hypothetical protein C0408_08825 [Odoribacter sp.]|nr:hypothetical protein [Odoribacter sp.]